MIGLILLILPAILWSMGGLLIKSVQATPMAIAGLRSLLAIPVLLVLLRPHPLSFSRDQLLGAVFYCGTVSLFVAANKMTTAANAILLQYTAPVYVAILSITLLHEPIHRTDWASIGLALFGMGLFFLDRLSTAHLWGNLMAILSGVSFGLMVVFLRRQKQAFPLVSIILGNLLTAVISCPFWIGVQIDSTSWRYLIVLGIFQLGLSYALYSIAICRVSAIEAIMVPVIEPILNPLWVWIFLREVPGRWAIPGGVLVIAASVLCSLGRMKNGRPEGIKTAG
ncbi:MAG: DMT family transporter [Phycisphaerae bacterium]|nr:DMT family transporter [Phycisphaerae bacterium]